MDVHDAASVCLDDAPVDELHVTGENDEICTVMMEEGEEGDIELVVASKLSTSDMHRWDAVFTSSRERPGVGLIADNKNDLSVWYSSRLDLLKDRLEVRSFPRSEDCDIQPNGQPGVQ